jgi:histidinol-phosphate/aromatic aminotransferase/cobyric acid decarboxylase-like protein
MVIILLSLSILVTFEFIIKDDFASGLDLFKIKPNVFITRTFSKIYGLAGLRIGWGYSSKEIIEAMYKIKPPFNVNRIAPKIPIIAAIAPAPKPGPIYAYAEVGIMYK